MSATELASALDAKPADPGRWLAKCPYHDDAEPSLTISEGDGGKTLVHCHAGCENVFERLRQDGYIKGPAPGQAREEPEIRYIYQNIDDGTAFEILRFPGKSFRARRPGPGGEWLWDLPTDLRVPYRLPELLNARDDTPIFIVEGEKDADRLAGEGFVATTNPLGAGKWRREYNQHFRDRHVIIVPDNDEAGRKHAAAVREQLTPVAASVRVMSLAGHVVEKGDVSDLIAAEGSDAFRQLVDQLPPPAPRDRPYLTLADLEHLPGPEWLVDGLIPKHGLVLLYGDSGVGKSFVAIDMGLRIAAGRPVLGRPASAPGLVVYVALEGQQGLGDRTLAARKEISLEYQDPAPFIVWKRPLSLADSESVAELTAGVQRAKSDYHADAALVVIDTLFMAMPGANENSPDDMSRAISGITRIQRDTGATVLAIHHSGKTVERGARGHSSLRAAVDTELLVSFDKRGKALTVTKQRDGADQIRIPFDLATIALPVADDGKARESRVVRVLQDEAGEAPTKGLSQKTRVALKALQGAIRDNGCQLSEVERQSLEVPPGTRVVTTSEWLEACRTHKLTSAGDEALKKARSRAAKKLRGAGLLGEAGDFYWPTTAGQTPDGRTGPDRPGATRRRKDKARASRDRTGHPPMGVSGCPARDSPPAST